MQKKRTFCPPVTRRTAGSQRKGVVVGPLSDFTYTLQKQTKKLLPARQNRRSRIGKTGVALKMAFLLAVGQELAILELVLLHYIQHTYIQNYHNYFALMVATLLSARSCRPCGGDGLVIWLYMIVMVIYVLCQRRVCIVIYIYICLWWRWWWWDWWKWQQFWSCKGLKGKMKLAK